MPPVKVGLSIFTITVTIYKFPRNHCEVPLDKLDSTVKRKRLRCIICRAKCGTKCDLCSVPICSSDVRFECWNDFHMQREYDVQ